MRVSSVYRCNWTLSISPTSPQFSILMREHLIMKTRILGQECVVIVGVLGGGFGSEYTTGRGYLANLADSAHGKIWHL